MPDAVTRRSAIRLLGGAISVAAATGASPAAAAPEPPPADRPRR
ncbi:hypothetical protein [Streptomyces sp. XD-27]|nr:hypothetical protein [Streptomyces sp. XD-27]WKX73873.1 hypothetical protein Q3Y56_31955 [Streptomyces sp. XD-27]